MIMAAIFALICLGVAINGFISLADIADPAQLSDAKGTPLLFAGSNA